MSKKNLITVLSLSIVAYAYLSLSASQPEGNKIHIPSSLWHAAIDDKEWIDQYFSGPYGRARIIDINRTYTASTEDFLNNNRRLVTSLTLLQWAALMGSEKVLSYLIGLGADIEVYEPEHERRAIHFACYSTNVEIVLKLIEAYADMNAKSKQGTPLQIASRMNNYMVVYALLFCGAHVEEEDDDNTALHSACEMGHSDIVELLVYFGAEISRKNKKGFTPGMLATENGHKEIASFLGLVSAVGA